MLGAIQVLCILVIIKILLSDLTIFGAENRAEMTILGADFME